MHSFLNRYHLLWFILFCGAILSIPKITFLPLVHAACIIYSLWYLFILLPLFVSRTLFDRTWHILDIFFSGLFFFFFFFVPLFYSTTKLHITSLQLSHILLSLISIILTCYLYLFFKKPPSKETLSISIPNIKKEDSLFLAALLTFFVLHFIYFYFYQFLPEWDGYTDILSIEKNLQDTTFHQGYRAYFQASVSILSSLLTIAPYNLFLYFFIPLQTISLFVLYRLFQRYNFSSIPKQVFLYGSFLSVPVIAMEIDMVRPQNILIIFVPIIFYLVLLWEKEKQDFLLLPIFIILLAGLKYHEFFWFFLMATPALFLPWLHQKKELFKKPSIRILSILGIPLFFILLFYLSATLQNFALKVLLDISDTSRWRWWFLSNYNNSNQLDTQVGWSGIMGTIQYYAYYLSPIITVLILILITQRKSLTSSRFLFQKSTLYFSTLLCTWIIFAEILPRLNSPFIPERYWLFFCLTLFFLFVSFLLRHKNLVLNKTLIIMIFLACFLGISASIYIAYSKKSLTTPHEYKAALWLKENTPADAIIISQPGNGPLIQNFAKKEIFIPKKDFFLDESYLSPTEKITPDRFLKIIEKLEKNPSPQNLYTVIQIKRIFTEQERLSQKPLYILYSNEKFSTLYSKRDWYQKQNFKNAHLEKFDISLEKIYFHDGISIWKIND